MLSDCRITVDTRGAIDFAFSIRQIFRWSFVASYTSRNVLVNSVLQFLANLTHVPTVTASYVLIYDHTLLKVRQNIFMNYRQIFSHCKNNARFNGLVTSVDNSLGLLFKIQRNFPNPRELQVNWTLLRSFFWFTVEKRNFLRHGDLNNAFYVSNVS